MSESNVQSGGVSFLSLLFLVFLTLKLTGYITWSWWYVTMPLWGGFIFFLTVLALFLVGAGLLWVVVTVMDWIKK